MVASKKNIGEAHFFEQKNLNILSICEENELFLFLDRFFKSPFPLYTPLHGYIAVFRQPRIQTCQYLDKYCFNQSESRQRRNQLKIMFYFGLFLSFLDSDWFIQYFSKYWGIWIRGCPNTGCTSLYMKLIIKFDGYHLILCYTLPQPHKKLIIIWPKKMRYEGSEKQCWNRKKMNTRLYKYCDVTTKNDE